MAVTEHGFFFGGDHSDDDENPSFRVVLLGGGPGVAELAAQNLRQRMPKLHIVDTLAPRLGLTSTGNW